MKSVNPKDLEFAIDQMHTEVRVRLKDGPFGSADEVYQFLMKKINSSEEV